MNEIYIADALLEGPAFLPGRLLLERGTARDYEALARFHYLPGRPASWAGTWRIVYHDDEQRDEAGRVVAVGVLSYPVLSGGARERALGLGSLDRAARQRFVNAHVRTISRVIVHPQFRSIGLSVVIVRALIAHCPTRFVEAIARMGQVHPMFERAGMTRVGLARHGGAVFLFDRARQGPAGGGGRARGG